MADRAVSTAVADAGPKVRAERILSQINDIITTALPSHMSRDKFRDVFMTAAVKEPKIFQADRTSVQQALIAAANSGLMPDGKMAALVPFKNTKANKLEVQFIVMVMGYIHLFKKHAGVHSMAVNVVYSNDEFTYIEGDETTLIHKPNPFAEPEERGEMVGVYGVFKDIEGRVMHREVMGKAAVMKAKAVSKMSSSGPWQNFEEEMWRKTLIRRASKYLPLTAEAQRILDAEDAATIDFDLPTRQISTSYNPLAEAAGVTQVEQQHDEDGVVIEDDEAPFTVEGEDDSPAAEEEDDEIDLDAVQEREEVEEERKPAADEQKPTEDKKPAPAAQARSYSDRELDAAWDAGLDAKEAGKPREVPDAYADGKLAETWLKAWDKGEVKPPKEEKATKKTPPKDTKAPEGPDPDVVRDARSKALDGAEREPPENLSADQVQHWLAAYDDQVREANENG